MKHVSLIVALFLVSFLSAQTTNDYLEITRDVIKTEKKAAIAEVMELSETESQPFWNLYNEYEGKLYALGNKRIEILMSLPITRYNPGLFKTKPMRFILIDLDLGR